jgi:hypothetical protein
MDLIFDPDLPDEYSLINNVECYQILLKLKQKPTTILGELFGLGNPELISLLKDDGLISNVRGVWSLTSDAKERINSFRDYLVKEADDFYVSLKSIEDVFHILAYDENITFCGLELEDYVTLADEITKDFGLKVNNSLVFDDKQLLVGALKNPYIRPQSGALYESQ